MNKWKIKRACMKKKGEAGRNLIVMGVGILGFFMIIAIAYKIAVSNLPLWFKFWLLK